jgi:hypothetical protein
MQEVKVDRENQVITGKTEKTRGKVYEETI